MFLDVVVPGMSGVDVLEVLPETLDANVAPVVVMLTGEADAAAAACKLRLNSPRESHRDPNRKNPAGDRR